MADVAPTRHASPPPQTKCAYVRNTTTAKGISRHPAALLGSGRLPAAGFTGAAGARRRNAGENGTGLPPIESPFCRRLLLCQLWEARAFPERTPRTGSTLGTARARCVVKSHGQRQRGHDALISAPLMDSRPETASHRTARSAHADSLASPISRRAGSGRIVGHTEGMRFGRSSSASVANRFAGTARSCRTLQLPYGKGLPPLDLPSGHAYQSRRWELPVRCRIWAHQRMAECVDAWLSKARRSCAVTGYTLRHRI